VRDLLTAAAGGIEPSRCTDYRRDGKIQFYHEIPVTEASDKDDTVTDLLHRWSNGDRPAGDRLFALVYAELRTVAKRQRRRWSEDDTLNTTALVHEVYLRLNGAAAAPINDRAHFYAVAARATRHILSNYARRARTQKRGGGSAAVDIVGTPDEFLAPPVGGNDVAIERLWALEQAMQQLHKVYPRACQVVECRYLGGLSIAETALALGIAEATVKRDWTLAQAWLYRELKDIESTHG
jgi:RNA polymerase sigma factor (TIGR02999 family)